MPSTDKSESPKAPKFKLPPTLGACADRLYTIRESRYKIEKQVKLLEAEETALKDKLIKNLPKSQASGVAGRICRVTITGKDIPQVKDWPKFYAYVKKTGSFEMLQRRLTIPAIIERWEEGKKVPGVESFKATIVSINKV